MRQSKNYKISWMVINEKLASTINLRGFGIPGSNIYKLKHYPKEKVKNGKGNLKD